MKFCIVNMKSRSRPHAPRWMAELAAAIDGAQRVAWELGAKGGSQAARDLYRQLEAARLELEALRGVTRRIREELDPWLSGQFDQPGNDNPAD